MVRVQPGEQPPEASDRQVRALRVAGGPRASRPSPSGTPRTARRTRRPAAGRSRGPCPRGTRGGPSSPSRGPSMYAACAFSDSTPASKVSVVSTAWVGRRGSRTPTPRVRRPTAPGSPLELLGEDPAVAGVAHGVEHRPADGDVVGLVEVAPAPGVAEVAGDHDVGTVAADLGGEQRGAAARRTRGCRRAGAGSRRVSTPTIRADSTCSASRTVAALVGVMPSMPASPLVTIV